MQLILCCEKGDLPVWANANVVYRQFGINDKQLYKLFSTGVVKSSKLPGDIVRSTRLYKVADIVVYLERLADMEVINNDL